MAMTDQEILSQAARLRAARRRKIAKTCDVCGAAFEGIVQRRYCSDRCRVTAARRRVQTEADSVGDGADPYRDIDAAIQEMTMELLQAKGIDIDSDDPEAEARRQRLAATVRTLAAMRDRIMRGRVLTDDSTEILRAEREKRSHHLASL